MTSKEALDELKFIADKELNTGSKSYKDLQEFWNYKKPLKVINDLVKRDTPKKPIVNIDNEIKEYNCGVCVCSLDIPQLEELNFCPKCGQRLDWGEE